MFDRDAAWPTMNIGAPLTLEKVDAAIFTMKTMRHNDPDRPIEVVVISPGRNDPVELSATKRLLGAMIEVGSVQVRTSWTTAELMGTAYR